MAITPRVRRPDLHLVSLHVTDMSRYSLVSSGRAKPIVYPETFPLARHADGLAALEKRKSWGKVIVHVREPEAPPHSKAKL